MFWGDQQRRNLGASDGAWAPSGRLPRQEVRNANVAATVPETLGSDATTVTEALVPSWFRAFEQHLLIIQDATPPSPLWLGPTF